MRTQVLAEADLRDARPVLAEDWAEGMGASLRAGLAAAEAWVADGVAVAAGRSARIGHESLRRLIAAWETGAIAAVATYDGVRRNPAVLDRSIFDGSRHSGGRGRRCPRMDP